MKYPLGERQIEMIVIGTSAGGVDALMKLLPCFKKPSMVSAAIVIHLPSKGENLIPNLVGPECDFSVKEALPGQPIEKETIYIAPPDYHLCLEPNKTLSLSNEAPVNFSRPSIDILFDSAAYAYQKNVLGILLTGSNHDGAEGLKTIKEQGGLTIVQDPQDLEFPAMPKAALDLFCPDFVMTLEEISTLISTISLKGTRYGN